MARKKFQTYKAEVLHYLKQGKALHVCIEISPYFGYVVTEGEQLSVNLATLVELRQESLINVTYYTEGGILYSQITLRDVAEVSHAE